MDDDLAPTQTEGFKVGEKKTIDEYKNLGRSTATSYAPLLQPRHEARCDHQKFGVTVPDDFVGWMKWPRCLLRTFRFQGRFLFIITCPLDLMVISVFSSLCAMAF